MFHETYQHEDLEIMAATCPHCGGPIPVVEDDPLRCVDCRKPFHLALRED